ncbi:coiled-coil domain-containing protein 28B isoform X1 [Venturia canescens]|uniref:coiled-coil domain-containing protein 28B isoform X1 n=1 Tax=Venturia canescens TaxID=32260 RepID=UPI001C9C95A4|nr:coiled-coil domain-containing protein 28B isoform X1 [Venturia canescens]XP_043279230.1 coiled-coil domain-containing protein 28B isoform X1 [Venturia canescens]
MNEGSGFGELQQLVQEEESEEPTSRGGEATPPSTPARSNRTSKIEVPPSHNTQQVAWESSTQISPIASKNGSSGPTTTSQASLASGKAANSANQASGTTSANQPRITYLNEKQEKPQKPSRPDPPRTTRQHRVGMTETASTVCKHHCFLSEVPDVRCMEQALLQLLEDFHSGNLRAFGKDCSMEQMTEIREQQERLARLHFELGQRQDFGMGGGEQTDLRQSSANMRHLLHRLQQLSVCIEKLHSK